MSEQKMDAERAAFEAWADSQWPGAKRQQLKRDNYGEYLNCIYRDMWRGWQARAGLPVGVPDVLFDGFAVMSALPDKAKARTSAENVSDVLDAVVKILRAAPSAPAGEAVPVAGVEAPEVVAYLLTKPDGKLCMDAVRHKPGSQPAEAVMLVAQHNRIVSQLAGGDSVSVPSELSAAATDVLAERQRQITAEGWTTEHDDRNASCELAAAAATYATCTEPEQLQICGAAAWPWRRGWWKPTTYRRNLIKAGALILAEIERLDRALLSRNGNGGGA